MKKRLTGNRPPCCGHLYFGLECSTFQIDSKKARADSRGSMTVTLSVSRNTRLSLRPWCGPDLGICKPRLAWFEE